ncbi:MAG: hypothetical protein M3443_20090 [Actinomycetota bacterium]|nr:hypothetical protein [Actinomycetota bacterium]
MRRWLVVAALLMGSVACQDSGTADPSGDLDQIESTLDNIDADLAGD